MIAADVVKKAQRRKAAGRISKEFCGFRGCLVTAFSRATDRREIQGAINGGHVSSQ